jgi:hypothetical protein
MRKALPISLVFLVTMSLGILQPITPAGGETLTNDGVVAMTKAGLSDAVILAKIRSSPNRFNVGTAGLIALKEAGVSDQVIEAMVASTRPGGLPVASAPVSPPTALTGPAPRPGRESIFHVVGDRYVELMPAVSSLETNFAFFTTKSEVVLKGRKAQYRTAERTPVFLSVFSPNEAPLVRLKPGDDHDDRNLKVSSGSFMPFGGTQRFGVRTKDTLEVESEKDPRGFYRITPRQPLPPGEYGFVLTHGLAAGASGKIYDFGID